MKLDIRQEQQVTIISVDGEVDAGNSTELGDSLDKLQADGNKKLVVDLQNVKFIDSSGLGTLVKEVIAVTPAITGYMKPPIAWCSTPTFTIARQNSPNLGHSHANLDWSPAGLPGDECTRGVAPHLAGHEYGGNHQYRYQVVHYEAYIYEHSN